MSRDEVTVTVGRRRLGRTFDNDAVDIEWVELFKLERYELDTDMLELEDAFRLEVPFTRDLFKLMVPDNAVKIAIDGVVVMVGFIDRVTRARTKSSGSSLSVEGRDKGGRLVDESMPLGPLSGLGILELAELAARPWFPDVSLSNARNRRLFRGNAKRNVRVSREPAIERDRKPDRKVNPGDKRGQVIEDFCKRADLLCWSSADGEEFIVGRPNYDQPSAFRFIVANQGDVFHPSMQVDRFEYVESVADCYAQIVVVGESKGTGVNYHSNVIRRVGRAFEGTNSDGTGNRFFFPKVLIVQDSDVRSAAEAQQRAEREMAERLSTNLLVNLTVPGHTQDGIVYHFDAMAIVDDREGFGPDDFLVTRAHFTGSKQAGKETALTLVPKNTILQLGGA